MNRVDMCVAIYYADMREVMDYADMCSAMDYVDKRGAMHKSMDRQRYHLNSSILCLPTDLYTAPRDSERLTTQSTVPAATFSINDKSNNK